MYSEPSLELSPYKQRETQEYIAVPVWRSVVERNNPDEKWEVFIDACHPDTLQNDQVCIDHHGYPTRLYGKHKRMITNSVHETVDRGKQYDSPMGNMNITTEVTSYIK